ncbi:MAG: 3-dehydroquinate synthase [Planctomycetia bacterium]
MESANSLPEAHRRTVPVDLGARSYQIEIGSGALSFAGEIFAAWPGLNALQGLRMLLIADEALLQSHAKTLQDSLSGRVDEIQLATVPSGEASKSWGQTQKLYDALVEMSADRRTVVVAVGGGVTGDLAGFVAATYARGLRFIQVPTTLLSMVDSSVGGKTGINHPRGKNLIGAFHQPVGVLIDPGTLNTLPDREYRAGLAEVVKYGVILDGVFFEYLEQHVAELNSREPGVLNHIIARSCELKAEVVREDEFETTGLRAVLNYGHTFGHAFEALAGYGELLHGEAVSIGMICASRLAEKLCRVSADVTQRQLQLLKALHLPTEVPTELQGQPDAILRCMMLDKKTESRELRFVLPDRLGHVETVRGVTADLALSVL